MKKLENFTSETILTMNQASHIKGGFIDHDLDLNEGPLSGFIDHDMDLTEGADFDPLP